MEGNGTGATPSLGRRADVAYPCESAEPDPARGAAERLQGPSKSQGPCGERRVLCGEPWCYGWETAGDRASVGRWRF